MFLNNYINYQVIICFYKINARENEMQTQWMYNSLPLSSVLLKKTAIKPREILNNTRIKNVYKTLEDLTFKHKEGCGAHLIFIFILL